MSWLEQFRPTPTPAPVDNGGGGGVPGGFEATVIAAEARRVRDAVRGTRNDTLNKAAFNLAQIIPVDVWRATLEAAGAACGLDPTEIADTIDSGIKGGHRNPRPAHRMPTRATHTGGVRDVLPELGHYQDPQEPPERSSWRHVDPEHAAMVEEHPPSYLTRQDGVHLFYPGKVNGLIGESESGKTWVALLAVTQALHDQLPVLYLDFEDTYRGITGRLASMGAPLGTFHYTCPDGPLGAHDRAELDDDLNTIQPALIVVDGFNAAMTLIGYDLNSNTDATAFAQNLLKPLSNTGACVIYVDHLPKNREAQGKGGIGAQAKRAMTTGCAIRVDVEQEFGRGMTGRLRLTVDKDRPGLVRANAIGAKHLGEAILTSTHDGTVTVDVVPAEPVFKPTTLMERVVEYLARVDRPASQNEICDQVLGRKQAIMQAIKQLQDEGNVRIGMGPNRSLSVELVVVPGNREPLGNRGSRFPTLREGTGTTRGTTDPGTTHDDDQEQWWQK